MRQLASIAALALLLASAPPAGAAGGPDPLTGRVWVEAKPASGLPGVMLVFFADGTLLMDSCWETYALRKWMRTAPTSLAWDEDGARIGATIRTLSPTELVLAVKAGREVVEHRYAPAKVPFVCPDMKR